MTKKLNGFLFFLTLFFLSLTSCRQAISKDKTKTTLINEGSCACTDKVSPPPPPDNYLVSADTILFNDRNRQQEFITQLISQKTIDFEGEKVQVFQIKSDNGISKGLYDFVLPIEYNKYWDELKIYKDSLTNSFDIGFNNLDSNYVQLLYSVSLDTLPFNKGLILIQYNKKRMTNE
ncbi:hypothetical protein [Niastella koreensis]|nr:hypothetical protein [Niastella koreensis]